MSLRLIQKTQIVVHKECGARPLQKADDHRETQQYIIRPKCEDFFY